MANSIAIRVYKIAIYKKNDRKSISIDNINLPTSVSNFMSSFIKEFDIPTENQKLERSWYFELVEDSPPSAFSGYIHYGTFGFESNFVDINTKKHNYHRKNTDIEEIPLFFEFWLPKNTHFGFAVFQSFQSRSCVQLITNAIKEKFKTVNPGYIISFQKIMPNDARGSAYYSAPVKKLRLINKNFYADSEDNYLGEPDIVDFEYVMSAKRNRSLGSFFSIFSKIKSGSRSMVVHRGIEFSEVSAEIKVGDKVRTVGILGPNKDFGVIDLTDSVDIGKNGHPTFQFLKRETDTILKDFNETLVGQQDED
ncbi:hypothetical protein [Elstera cyanobacteriorum]|uniref:hypothetical protein n=1 Tax=Elstera cyanobacteriorum TaxID=2022747 RepID=UPI0023537CEF|nr:hypothetical protein [Elstera cyanobacteriorum]MCK6444401.1 hypothetical protein [Elstera cyanobacteriorum]MCK6600083.1 hypothetical protein [Pseudobdellovibrionaceae bacterium]